MDTISLTDLAVQKLGEAVQASSGRAAATVYGGREHRLRQTIIAIRAGEGLAEHESPGEATLQVLLGRIVLRTDSERWELEAGDHRPIPDEVHAVDAPEDAVFLLTVAKREAHGG